MNDNYLNSMIALVNFYNLLPKENINDKNQTLILLLNKMYENTFNKKLNIGVLIEMCLRPQRDSVLVNTSLAEPQAKMEFDPKYNQLKIGNYLSIAEIDTPKDGKIISLQTRAHQNIKGERTFVDKNEAQLKIDHNWNFINNTDTTNFSATSLAPDIGAYNQPTKTKISEIRTYNDSGIEIKREINNKIILGIPYFQFQGYLYDKNYTQLNEINNIIEITRDQQCPFLAHIKSIDDYRFCNNPDMAFGEVFISENEHNFHHFNTCQTGYIICRAYSLDGLTSKIYKEKEKDKAIDACYNWISSDKIWNDFMYSKKLDSLEINQEVNKLRQDAQTYCKQYLNNFKK